MAMHGPSSAMANATCPPQSECKNSCQLACFSEDLEQYVSACCVNCDEYCKVGEIRKIVAVVILLVCLLLLAKGRWSILPTGRPMGAFLCAVLMALCGNLHETRSILDTPGVVDLGTLATLFGMTIAVGYFQDFGFMAASMKALQSNAGPRVLLLKVTLLTGLLAAVVTNDAAVIALTGPVLMELRKMKVPAEPFLLCLATSANIGSSLTLIGNPQNILIANFSKMPFFTFLVQSFLPVFVGLLLNYFFMLMFYHGQLAATVAPSEAFSEELGTVEEGVEDDLPFSKNHSGDTFLLPSVRRFPCKRRNAQLVAALVTSLGLLLGFILSDSVAWTALAGAVVLLLIEVYLRDGEGTRILVHVDGPLLVMIGSLCIVASGARMTGVPQTLYEGMNDLVPGLDMDYDSLGDVMLAMVFVTVLSNLFSNVPTVLLLAPSMQKANNHLGWLCLAWVSTVAGNLTLVGSIANLIVAEKSAGKGQEMTFWMHFRYAFWSTLIIIPVGCIILFYVVQPLFGF